ncbi:MAG: S24/S26 family peptidase [Bacteroides sp.]|nr:S24/S26 family peptidase [Roseburia sp.]MCM1347499.1 S24/S26 family peptidase [Bacteroides sp.]MCM1421640.1 S24/S26 family peptidase [Bacteroides sp.]
MKRIQLPNAEFIPQLCNLINEGHSVSIRIKGNSMRPFIENERDIVILSGTKKYEVGDVALAEIKKGLYVLHRIESIHQATVRLRGDGNIGKPEICTINDLRAVATAFIRDGKTIRTDSTKWRLYSFCWTRLLPARRVLLAIYRLWHKITTINHQP